MTAPIDAPARSAPTAVAANMVVARFRDGRQVKGTTQDFAPMKPQFHVLPGGDSAAVEIRTADLKALFFVKSYDGDSQHREAYSFERVKGHGRKATVTFYDGEVVAGYTMGYHADKPGFFMIPADENSNNARVFVVNAAVDSIRME